MKHGQWLVKIQCGYLRHLYRAATPYEPRDGALMRKVFASFLYVKKVIFYIHSIYKFTTCNIRMTLSYCL
jgi:hypothetical protein